MNTTTRRPQQRYTPKFGGNSVTESETGLILMLFETYLDAGLKQGDAWDAALADYAHSFEVAA